MMSSGRRALLILGTALLMATGYSAVSVGADQGGLTVTSGGINVSGDISTKSGTTVWNSANGYIPSSQVQKSGLNADSLDGVSLGNIGWQDVSMAKSDVSASNVGLGNVQNEAQVGESGDTMSGTLDMQGNTLFVYNYIKDEGSNGNYIKMSDGSTSGGGMIMKSVGSDLSGRVSIWAEEDVRLQADDGGGNYECYIAESDGSWNCDGTKNWMHNLNGTHTAFYTSQESPEVRAVYEDSTTVKNGRMNVSLPSHFEKTVSDSRPGLRVQATPRSLATVAVTERSDSWIVIEASKDVKVDYRVTGIREGYEDKDVVRQQSN